MHRQRSMTNEQHELNFVKYLITSKNNSKKKFASINIKQSQSNQKIKKKEKNHVSSKNFNKLKKIKRQTTQIAQRNNEFRKHI